MSVTLEQDFSEASVGRDSDGFRIAIFGQIEDPAEVTDVLTAVAGLHPDDALRAAHLIPGLMPMRFPKDIAGAVSEKLNQRGLRTLAVSNTELPSLDYAQTIHHAYCTAEGLELLGIHGELKRLVRWRDVSLLSAGCVRVEDGQRRPADPQVVLHAAPNPQRTVAETALRDALILWVACEQPWQVYRFVHNQLSYQHLGSRKTGSSIRNFGLFLEDLAHQAPHAYLTPATRALLHHGIRRHFEFHSLQELRDYTVFHLLAQRLVRQPSAPACPPAVAADSPSP